MQTITVRAFLGRGLESDRYFASTVFYPKKSSYGGREVTLIEIEAVDALFGDALTPRGNGSGSSSPLCRHPPQHRDVQCPAQSSRRP